MNALTPADVMMLARFLDVPVTDHEVVEVTVKLNNAVEAIMKIDRPDLEAIDPIPWFADVDWGKA